MRTGARLNQPAHPGGFVKTEIIDAYGLSVTDAAKALGASQGQLPARRMAQLDKLLAKIHRAAASGRQVNRPDRHLGGQAECISRHRPIGHDHLTALDRKRLDRLFDGWRMRAEPAGDRT